MDTPKVTSDDSRTASAARDDASAWQRRLTLWDRIAAESEQWAGGTLVDCDADPLCNTPEGGARTRLLKLTADVQGDYVWFCAEGEEFCCGGSSQFLAVAGKSRYGDGLELRGYGGHEWHILHPTKAEGRS